MASYPKVKQQSFDISLAILLVLFSVFLNQLLLSKAPLFQRWDNLFYDLISTSITNPADNNIVIIDIDEVSLKALGRWPWPRATHARLINQLTASGVAGVAMDILFMEPDLEHPENDQLLADAIRRNGRVIMPVLTSTQSNRLIITEPLEKIANAAAQLAHVTMDFDSQGIARQLDLQIKQESGEFLPSMSLALSRFIDNHQNPRQIKQLKSLLISFINPPGQFHHISYIDVLRDKNIKKEIQGKLVLIGVTAAGLGRRIATPTTKNQQLMTGIEFQANAVATIISGQIIRPLSWTAHALLSLLLIGIPILVFRFFKSSHALLVALSFSILAIACSAFLLSKYFLWFSPLPSLFCLIISYPLWSWRRVEQLSHSLFNEHEKASAILEAVAEAVITTNKQGYIEYMNPAAERLLALSLFEAKQKLFSEICQINNATDPLLLGNRTLIHGKAPAETQIIRNQNGEEYTVQVYSSPLHNKNKQLTGYVYALNNLTEIINIHQKIAFIASHDALTGLPNRILLQDRLEQAIIKANRDNLQFALLFIDLDGFKKINDAMGHASGDLLLQEVAIRLRGWIRKSDTLARWGGDEFIILLDNLTSPAIASNIAKNIIHGLSLSFILNKHEVFVSSSIGISLFPGDGRQSDELLEKADTAMYNVKNSGRNNFCFYSQKLESQAKERLQLETELRKALDLGELEMYYQPQIDLKTNQLIGAEALIRWNHPEKGLISPAYFIPLAEENGLIIPIGEWIIKEVCAQLKSWKVQNLPALKVAINLSTQQFTQKDLVSIITREIEKQALSTASIQVEITESMMVQDINQVISILDSLKSAGISIAVDDFGTGYSSLEYLKRFPIDKLKIDKSFIDNVMHDNDDTSIVQAVIALGHKMNMQIIAEGVENDQQAQFLKEHHCDYGQGYLFSKPLDAQKMALLIEKFKQNKPSE